MSAWLDVLTSAKPDSGFGVRVLKSAFAALAAPVQGLIKPDIDRGKMSVTSVLTTQTPDRQGDIIDPTGGVFDEHQSNPVVMFHHGKQHKLPIGKAEDPRGNYTVRLIKGADGDALVGTTYFSQSSKFANEVFGLIAEDILRGVSIGFDPLNDPDSVDELGPSPVLKRPALHFKGWTLLEYSHTPLGVNRDALTVAVQKSLDGSRTMHPQLLDYLKPWAEGRKAMARGGAAVEKGCAGMTKPQKAAVAIATAKKKKPAPGVRKAMPDDDDDDDTQSGDEQDQTQNTPMDETDPGAGVPDDNFDPTEDDPGDDPALAGTQYATPEDDTPPPTVQTLTDGAQGLLDLRSAVESGMKKSEHMKGRKYAAKLCADLKQIAAEVKQFADKVRAELAGAPTDGGEDTAPGDDSDNDDMPAEAPETDDEGAIVTKGYSPRRWIYADAAGETRVTSTADAQQLKALQDENNRLKRTLEGLLNDIEAADRRGR